MKWENLKAKLLSRKFWLMVTTFIGLILVAANVNVFTVEKIIGVITSFSILAIYIIGETITDIANRQLTAGEEMVVSVAQKLSSRKFWAALISFITTLMFTLGVNALTIEQVEAMIMAIATVAVYILGESAVDASKINAEIKQNLLKVEQEKNEITDTIIGQFVPANIGDWKPMYVSASNKVCTNIYTEPNAESVFASIAHLTQIFVEPDMLYGENNGFYKFVTEKSGVEKFIPIGVCVEGYVNIESAPEPVIEEVKAPTEVETPEE